MSEILADVHAGVGQITLHRPKALNALTLSMVRDLTAILMAWEHDPKVEAVAIRGQGKESPFGAFCAGGDIRFFHQAALVGDPRLEDFFTEEYSLNHMIHRYSKPYAAFLDGIVMGGGMGISGHTRDGSCLRIVTERTRMAMPETNIGLFPDVGGGYFLSRCPGRFGEYLALTGQVIGGIDARQLGLADVFVPSARLEMLWADLAQRGWAAVAELDSRIPHPPAGSGLISQQPAVDQFFSLETVKGIVGALEADQSAWASETAAVLRKRSPLMLHVVLEQIRRGRQMELADELRMERVLVRHSFHLRAGAASETVEGIRALAVDKDLSPRWSPARIEEVPHEIVQRFFESPWPAHAHPLRHLR
ncbi:MAG: enoyl-CoA hydratase/isomerase family protein [Ramlibacter sp.]|nr:enoyl-CoA hydratase/isomerase family protein [Ramlibacter sp.]